MNSRSIVKLREIAAHANRIASELESRNGDEVSNFHAVGEFHQQFGFENTLNNVRVPHHISNELWNFRVKFLREELTELYDAYVANDLPKIADSLVDLVYVALGTAHLHGLPWEELFTEVQRANMTKERCKRPEDSTRGSTFDVVKPAGWRPPNIIEVLMRAGWKGPALPMGE